MPVTIKAANLKYKDGNGEYVGVNSISDKTTAEQLAAINAAGAAQVAAVNTAGTTQKNAVNSAGSTQVNAVNTAGATQVAAVNTKGQEVLDSIPEDYSTLSENVSSVMSAINELEPVVESLQLDKADVIISSASGAIASFPDGADGMPIKSMTVQIEPVQDLHGYDSPWPAGGGKNKFIYPFVDTTKTVNGITFTDLGNGQIRISGTNTGSSFATFELLSDLDFGENSHNFASSSMKYVQGDYTMFVMGLVAGIGCYYEGNGTGRVYLRVTAGATIETTVSPMIYATVDDLSDFVPYKNGCPITGWTGANVTRTGENLFDKTVAVTGESVKNDGSFVTNRYITRSVFIPVVPNEDYYVGFPGYKGYYPIFYYDAFKNFIDKALPSSGNAVVTTPQGCAFVILQMVNEQVATACFNISDISQNGIYEPYQGQSIPITFPSEAGTVYGGSLTVFEDGTGRLVVNRAKRIFDGTGVWTVGAYSNYRHEIPDMKYGVDANTVGLYCESLKAIAHADRAQYTIPDIMCADGLNVEIRNVSSIGVNDIDSLKAWLNLNNVVVYYPLATTIIYDLTALEVLETLKGMNNVWADTGDTNVTYRADTKLYIDNRITQAIAAALNA